MSTSRRKEKSPMNISPRNLPADQPVGALEPVAYFNGAMPTGVTVSQQGRIFVNFPKWGDDVAFTVAEIQDGESIAYPDEAMNQTNPDDLAAALVSGTISCCRSGRPSLDSRYRQAHCSSLPNSVGRS